MDGDEYVFKTFLVILLNRVGTLDADSSNELTPYLALHTNYVY